MSGTRRGGSTGAGLRAGCPWRRLDLGKNFRVGCLQTRHLAPHLVLNGSKPSTACRKASRLRVICFACSGSKEGAAGALGGTVAGAVLAAF